MSGNTDTKRPAGYIENWRPYRKGQIMLGQVQQILEEYEQHLPLTVQQIYYRMIAAYRHPKGEQFKASLGDLLSNARRARVIPFDSIRDDGIMGGAYWAPDLATALRGYDLDLRHHRTDRQVEQDVRVEVWCEAAGMIPQLETVADPYSVQAYSCSGFNSLPAIRQIVNSVVAEERDTVVLHLGDYDPSGVSIFERVVTDVRAFLEVDAPHASFEGVRVAITERQIEEHKLPMDPITTKDTRSRAWFAQGKTEKCELEALPPDLIAETLRDHIEMYVDRDVYEEAVDRERLEAAALKSLPSGISYLPGLEAQIRDRPLQTLYPPPIARPAARGGEDE